MTGRVSELAEALGRMNRKLDREGIDMTPKDLPELPAPQRGFQFQGKDPVYSPDVVQRIQREAYELGARSTAAQPVEQTSAVTVLPDGSAFMTGSLPLPKDHWIFAPRCAEWDNVRDTSADTPHPILNNSHRAAVRAAMRYAIRGATMCGKDMDFDPDALVLNAAYALCGPAFGVTLPVDAPPAASGDSTPPSEPAGWSPQSMYDAIKDVLEHHRLSYAVVDEDSPCPLVDALSFGRSTSVGRDEVAHICDAIYNEVLTKAQGDPSGALRPEPEAAGQDRGTP